MRRRELLATLGTTGLASGCQGTFAVGRRTAVPTRRVAVRDVTDPEFRGARDGPFTGSVSVLNETIDGESTARLELELTNVGDDSVRITRNNVGYILGLYSGSSESAALILQNGEADPQFVEPLCWRLSETFPPDGVYSTRLEGGETVRSVRFLYGSPTNDPRCLPAGLYRFERYNPGWSFTLAVEQA